MMRFLKHFLAAGVALCLTVPFSNYTFAEDTPQTQTDELPDYEVLAKYEPPVMSRIHAADGGLMAEFATNRRLYLPIQSVDRKSVV